MATSLRVIDQRRPPTPCSLLLQNAELAKLVDDIQPGIDQRLPTPAERASLERLVPGYEAALTPATPEEIEEAVAMLSLAYPAMRASVSEAGARLELYTKALAHLPPDILEMACMAALRQCIFFPSVAEILARANGLALRQWRLQRIQYLIAKHDREWREPEPEERLTAEQREKVDAYLRRSGIGTH